MRAIAIDPKLRTVKEVHIRHDANGSLADMQAAVGGLIELATTLPNGDDVFVNDEGLFLYRDFFVIDGAHQPFAGPAIVLNHTPFGSSRPVRSTVADITNLITWGEEL